MNPNARMSLSSQYYTTEDNLRAVIMIYGPGTIQEGGLCSGILAIHVNRMISIHCQRKIKISFMPKKPICEYRSTYFKPNNHVHYFRPYTSYLQKERFLRCCILFLFVINIPEGPDYTYSKCFVHSYTVDVDSTLS